MPKIVPNEPASISLDYRIAFVGECPGSDETSIGRPFVGPSGRLLTAVMQNSGIIRNACLMGNISQEPLPWAEDAKKINLDQPCINRGLAQLRLDLREFDPNLIVLLGNYPLKAAGVQHSVSSFRGSLFTCNETSSPFFGHKCLSTFNPAAVVRNYDWMPLLRFDISKAKRESFTSTLTLPERRFDVELSVSEIIQRLDSIQDGELTSIDIEGGIPPQWPGVTCIGISTSPEYGFIIPLGQYGIEDSLRVIRALARVLCNPLIPKVLQNSLYDNFVLSWIYKLPIRNVMRDTMLSGWEIYPELPKALGVQTSIWTDQPYYKFERTINDTLTHYRYCCMDACVTLEIAQKHMKSLESKPDSLAHFQFNMSLLPAFLYMELKGIKFDKELCKTKLDEVSLNMQELITLINSEAGCEVNPNSSSGANSLSNILYKKLQFEPQYKKEGGRKTDKTTCDVNALLVLLKKFDNPIIFNLLKWRKQEGLRKQLMMEPDHDDRARSTYNVVGTDTGRLSNSESPTGNGTNLQTITKKLRCLFKADEGYEMFQCDLSGADGWTVAAHCFRLGDSTMFDDYQAGIKPARVIAAMYEASKVGMSISRMNRDDLKAYIKSIKIPEWLYFSCKRVQHGSNYLLGAHTMSDVILKDSWNIEGQPIYINPKDCEKLKQLYLSRYWGVTKWQDWVAAQIKSTGKLECCSGHTRPFFGRLTDPETQRSACSHEPQANTTYVTNLALFRLWNDCENRTNQDSLIIQPLHQVHDALIGQYKIEQRAWAHNKIRTYFNNPVTIAGKTLVIPFEGGYGPSWGELDNTI